MTTLQGKPLGRGAKPEENRDNWEGMMAALRRRWIKQYLTDDDGGVCLLGAVCVANGSDGVADNSSYVLPMFAVIKEQFPERFDDSSTTLHTIARFNNHPDTTLEDVMLVVEKAAAKE